MKRFSRAFALFLSFSFAIAVISGVTASEDDFKKPTSVQNYIEMLD